MSCCGGNCGCGSGCKCGNSCRGCKTYPEMDEGATNTTSQTLITGVAPPSSKVGYPPYEGSAAATRAESGGSCKCNPCTCNPCTCNPDTSQTLIMGIAPPSSKVGYPPYEGSAVATGAENGGCKCNPCTCNPCTCK